MEAEDCGWEARRNGVVARRSKGRGLLTNYAGSLEVCSEKIGADEDGRESQEGG